MEDVLTKDEREDVEYVRRNAERGEFALHATLATLDRIVAEVDRLRSESQEAVTCVADLVRAIFPDGVSVPNPRGDLESTDSRSMRRLIELLERHGKVKLRDGLMRWVDTSGVET